jgi:hypothetical protein
MDQIKTEKVRHILQKHFQRADWNISQPKDGQYRTSYIAQSKEQQLFIKFDVPIDALQRLSEIEVAPLVLASGVHEGTSYAAQEYINDIYPDWQWFATHLPLLASFIKRYHFDDQLTFLLSKTITTKYDDHVALNIATLETQFRSLHENALHTPEIATAFDELKNQAQYLHSAKLVPVHPDPNTKNMLLVNTHLRIVDWDNVQLSDPVRDVGLLLWWYVAPQQWPIFFQAYDLPFDEYVVERIYWWAARTSFAVALWHVEHEYDCTAFLQDFVAALNKCSNPHAVFQ